MTSSADTTRPTSDGSESTEPESARTGAGFLGLRRIDDTVHELTMRPRLVGGALGALFGGVGLAAGVVALADVTERPPVYVTCQFAATVSPPQTLRLETQILASGRTTSQGRVVATCDDQTILTLLGATGQRTEQHRSMASTMPVATPPEDLEPLRRTDDTDSLHHHVDVRMASGMFGFAPDGAPGRGTSNGTSSTLFWTRMPGVRHDAAALALMADYLPSAVGNRFGEQVFCSSLDNTIRFVEPFDADDSSEWILCESHVEFVAAGFAATRGLLWRRDGTLMATANQSMTAARPRP